MRYQPVRAARITQYTMPDGGRLSLRAVESGKAKQVGKSYWRACCKSLGDCPHKHKTEEAAQSCVDRLRRKFSRLQSARAKSSAAKRRNLRKACNQMQSTMPVTVGLVRMANGL